MTHNLQRRQFALTTIALSTLCTLPATAQPINEEIKLLADDPGSGSLFGDAVAIAGDIAVIGARAENQGGSAAGAAYIFNAITGQQLYKVLSSDIVFNDFFGFSVAASGTTAIIGAPGDDDAGSESGSAYLFNTTTGQQLFKLTAADAAADDRFGESVSISGSTAIVGVERDDDAGANTGSAYLFDTTTGQQLFKLAGTDTAEGDQFGTSVAISGTTAIVGAPFDADTGAQSGSAYIFDTTTGQQLFKLTANDAAESDQFGISVAISGTTAIVGSWRDDDAASSSGSAYLFDTQTGLQTGKLTAPDGASFDYFGFAVAISGNTAIAGAWRDDDAGTSSGSAYTFDTVTGNLLAKLVASDAAAGDNLGLSVGISGNTAVAGALGNADAGSFTGSAYLFNTATPNPADLNGDGQLDFLDISAFLAAYSSGDPIADFNMDGQYDFLDISEFLSAYSTVSP